MTGYCIYCGQSFMTEAETESVANIVATMNCKCVKAIEHQRVEDMRQQAENHVEVLFKDQPEETKELLKSAIENIAQRRINSATIKISERITATVKRGKDGIVVSRKFTEENTLE